MGGANVLDGNDEGGVALDGEAVEVVLRPDQALHNGGDVSPRVVGAVRVLLVEHDGVADVGHVDFDEETEEHDDVPGEAVLRGDLLTSQGELLVEPGGDDAVGAGRISWGGAGGGGPLFEGERAGGQGGGDEAGKRGRSF